MTEPSNDSRIWLKTVAVVGFWLLLCSLFLLQADRFLALIYVPAGIGTLGALIGGGIFGRPLLGLVVVIGALIAYMVVGVAIYGVPC